MINELHAGLHARYLGERQEKVRCIKCKSNRVVVWSVENNDCIENEYPFCFECDDTTAFDVETFEEWAERNEIDLNEI